MKKQLLLIILTSLLITSSSYAGTVEGYIDCDKAIKYDRENNLFFRESVISWFNGFFSGVNWEGHYLLNLPDEDSVYYAIVKYCNENPVKNSANASIEIYLNLSN